MKAGLLISLLLLSGCSHSAVVLIDNIGTLYGSKDVIVEFSKEYVKQTVEAFEKESVKLKLQKESHNVQFR